MFHEWCPLTSPVYHVSSLLTLLFPKCRICFSFMQFQRLLVLCCPNLTTTTTLPCVLYLTWISFPDCNAFGDFPLLPLHSRKTSPVPPSLTKTQLRRVDRSSPTPNPTSSTPSRTGRRPRRNANCKTVSDWSEPGCSHQQNSHSRLEGPVASCVIHLLK